MSKAHEITEMWKEIRQQMGKMINLCHQIESKAELHDNVTADAFQKGYDAALDDLWEAMQKAIKMYCEIDNEVYLRVFYDVNSDWGESVLQALFKNTPQHLIDSIRKYEQRQEEQRQEEQIQVGDEVITASGKAVVMGVGPVHFEYANADGSYGYDKVKNVKKTGRHFHEIAEVLQKMRDNN